MILLLSLLLAAPALPSPPTTIDTPNLRATLTAATLHVHRCHLGGLVDGCLPDYGDRDGHAFPVVGVPLAVLVPGSTDEVILGARGYPRQYRENVAARLLVARIAADGRATAAERAFCGRVSAACLAEMRRWWRVR